MGNSLPQLSINIHENSTFYWDNSVLNYKVSVSDREDGVLGNEITEDEVVTTIDYLKEGLDRNIIVIEHGELSWG